MGFSDHVHAEDPAPSRRVGGGFAWRLIEAARARDAVGVLDRTDMARVRRSLVDQIVAAYLKHLGRDRPVKPLEQLVANTYGANIADAMIAKILTGENLTAILNKGAINSDGAPNT